jgi:hypothetical protein
MGAAAQTVLTLGNQAGRRMPRAGRDFHDREGFATAGSIKVFAIMENAGDAL